MKRLLPRPSRRRATADGTEPATEVQVTASDPGVPAGAEPPDATAPPRPSFRDRGRLRRRLRLLRRVRELGFRDLGGLVFDQHKFNQPNEALVRGKLAVLVAVDAEMRALEHALADHRDITELREPGVSACPRCATLHGSDARFCPSCGLSLRGARAVAADVGEGAHPSQPELRGGAPTEGATPGEAAHAPAPEPATARPPAGGGVPDGHQPPTAFVHTGAQHRER
jgi:hypothetical protein